MATSKFYQNLKISLHHMTAFDQVTKQKETQQFASVWFWQQVITLKRAAWELLGYPLVLLFFIRTFGVHPPPLFWLPISPGMGSFSFYPPPLSHNKSYQTQLYWKIILIYHFSQLSLFQPIYCTNKVEKCLSLKLCEKLHILNSACTRKQT